MMRDPTIPLDMLGREIELNDTVAYPVHFGNSAALKLAKVTLVEKVPKMDGGYVRVGVTAFAEGTTHSRYTSDSWVLSGRQSFPSVTKMVIVTKYAGSIGEAVDRDEEGRS